MVITRNSSNGLTKGEITLSTISALPAPKLHIALPTGLAVSTDSSAILFFASISVQK